MLLFKKMQPVLDELFSIGFHRKKIFAWIKKQHAEICQKTMKVCFLCSIIPNGPVITEEKSFDAKSYRTHVRTTDNSSWQKIDWLSASGAKHNVSLISSPPDLRITLRNNLYQNEMVMSQRFGKNKMADEEATSFPINRRPYKELHTALSIYIFLHKISRIIQSNPVMWVLK